MGALVAIDGGTESEPDAGPTFEDFWTLYPRRVAKRDALKAWAKVPASEHLAVVIATAAWRRVWLKRGELDYIPYPATWLNGWRWEDELPSDVAQLHASHVTAVLPAAGERREMPAHVREMIAKLKGQR